MLGVIPSNRIPSIGGVGDERFDLPQLYCHYNGVLPFIETYVGVETIGPLSAIRWVKLGDPLRVGKFPDRLGGRTPEEQVTYSGSLRSVELA